MLDELHVKDLALIEEAWLELGPGMTVLTGETGAGKTALLGALKLLLGERADTGSVRAGSTEALVEGRFTSAGVDVVVRRRVGVDGRSRCAINGEMATVGSLAETVGPLVDLHGQHEHQALLAASSHVGYLDRWAAEAVESARAAYAAAFAGYSDALRDHEALAERLETASRDADYLRFVADEIGRVDPDVGEDEALRARLPALQHAEKLAEAASSAARALRDEGGAIDRVGEAAAALSRVQGIDPAVDEIASRLAEVQALLDDASATAREYRDTVEDDPRTLDETLARLSALSGLTKKYGPTLDDVIARRSDALDALACTEEGTSALDAAADRVESARAELTRAGRSLASARESAAPDFVAAIESATEDLAMAGASFEVSFSELPFERWTAEGPHRVEFLYAAAPGQPRRSLTRVASGGELSRVMLALKGVLGAADTVETLVFDEVDAGIGGATATAVGARLSQLAKGHQVVVVTHLAQVAAFADDHLVVSKHVSDAGAATAVYRVSGDERVAEVARMLSGNDSEASRSHARELLGGASAVTAAP